MLPWIPFQPSATTSPPRAWPTSPCLCKQMAACAGKMHVNTDTYALTSFILLGILVSYLPQHYRIISRRSSFGLSPYFVLLGTTSGTCQFANILVLPRSRADIACCKEISGFACFAGLLGIAQVGVQWSCFTVMCEKLH